MFKPACVISTVILRDLGFCDVSRYWQRVNDVNTFYSHV